MDLADKTVGIHAAASTFTAYIRPWLLQSTSNREKLDDIHGAQLNDGIQLVSQNIRVCQPSCSMSFLFLPKLLLLAIRLSL